MPRDLRSLKRPRPCPPSQATADDEDGTSQLSAVTPGRTEAAARGRHLRSPSSGSSAAGSLGSRPDAQQPVVLAARAQEMEAEVAAAKEQAIREQRHRHTASISALRDEQANLERAKRELESCLIAARNQAALLQACQREESGEGAQCWEQAAAEVEARIAAAQAAAVAEYDAREAAARQAQAAQAAEVRRAAQELAALRRAATLELQQLQAATGVTIGSCSACRLPMSEASGGGSSGPAASPLEVVRAPARRRRGRGRGKGAPAGRACCTIM
ncbi:hypothetical protein COHA_008131 [Chlorella ohadii]|uniref:Uncharacterized protein n=1 Tax=Chlorella ohadii TaxID=2649997 RepID=A0AAD5DHZ6_9CHLO|nr:hypothetical protein COHA_008131 [Chlorella ohadii]